MKLKRLSAILLTLAMVFALAACSSGTSKPSESTNPSPSAPTDSQEPSGNDGPAVSEWVIPVLSAVTGPIAFVGEPAAWAAQYAADQINAAGGINGVPVRVEIHDTEFSPETGAQIASGLVGNSLFILGCMAAPVSTAIGPIISEAGVPNVGSYSFAYLRDEFAPYAYGYMSDSEAGDLAACTAWCEAKGYKNIVLVYDPTDESMTASRTLFEKELGNYGINITGIVEVETGTLNVGSAAVQALNYKDADAYFLVLRKDEASKMIVEMRNRGVDSGEKFFCTFSAFDQGLIDLAGEAGEDVYVWTKLDVDYNGDDWNALCAAYAEKFGTNPSAPPVPGFYNAMIALKQCYEELNITGDPAKLAEERQAIANWFYNSPVVQGIQGPVQWTKGEMTATPFNYQIKNGAFVKVEF